MHYLLLAFTLNLIFPFHSLFADNKIEFVESIPLETNLDNSDIRNTADVWVEMINSAERSIALEHFYFSPRSGTSTDRILAAIYQAAERGVQIRVIADAHMTGTYPETVDELAEYENIQVHSFDLHALGGGVLHAKIMIIDNKELFIGSQNFDWRALEHIHELGLRIKNRKLLRFYQAHFELDWKLSAPDADRQNILASMEEKPGKTYRVEMRSRKYGKIRLTPAAANKNILIYPGNFDEDIILEQIKSAEQSIRIQLLSYSFRGRDEDYLTLHNALIDAASRDVKIEMILSDWVTDDRRIEQVKTLNGVDGIRVYLSTIPEYSGGYISYARVEHCKYMIIDGKKFWLGTSNWSGSYFKSGRNFTLSIENRALSERLEAIFAKSRDSEYCKTVKNGHDYESKFYGEKD